MTNYHNRFIKVLQYIDMNLEQHDEHGLSLERLSAVACLSKYHFHRQFFAVFGLTLVDYVKQLRLKRAAFMLAYRGQIKIIDIALVNGYDSSEAFSRAFRQAFGQSPSNFRKSPQWQSWQPKHQLLNKLRAVQMKHEAQQINVEITYFYAVKVATFEHKGPPALLGQSIREFIEWRKSNKLSPLVSRTFNLLYDDPKQTKQEDFRFDLCAERKSDVEQNQQGIVTKQIPGGRCARVRHIGTDENIGSVVNYLYDNWLTLSGETLRDFQLFFERVSFFPDVPEHQMITDIYLPIN